ncbi:glycosyltransferase family 39 protein [Sphingomonas lenta]|uniref:DUF2029 domain-containing protein n=1 Tax=Sphingomonas lenta TaxID=1141887 RepID=A0A2A2SCH3_9SPHN|nr:glycosyltransferase family 39 protein [Sphingomonas lenta]PAX06913.1 DUF2029 domain-containing protein [Sphingomonas lenta]
MRAACWAALTLLFALLSLARPVDHDESQYVAATVLAAKGLLPYRDFAYLQTPLQPLLLAPVAWIAGAWTWPALRLVNAALGAVAVAGVHRAARESAGPGAALIAAALFAGCDVLLFSIGTARNDALPAALLASALPLVVRAEQERGTRTHAVLIGLLLAGAAAAKISYALPAAAYGLSSLARRRHHPPHVALGASLPAALVAWTYLLAPEGFVFGVLDFPVRAPLDWYADRPVKLSLAVKLLDAFKFLALGASLPALLLVARRLRPSALTVLLAAGLVAALLPTPTWRQYLLPALPPLFVLLAIRLHERPPGPAWRIALAVFAAAGLAPTVAALAGQGLFLAQAMRQSAAVRATLDRLAIRGPVATLSPQFLPAAGRLPTPEFATGPFYFRSDRLLGEVAERRLRLISRSRPRLPGSAVLVGGEGRHTSGSDLLDAQLAQVARQAGWREVPVPGTRFRVFTPPAYAAPRPVPHSNP